MHVSVQVLGCIMNASSQRNLNKAPQIPKKDTNSPKLSEPELSSFLSPQPHQELYLFVPGLVKIKQNIKRYCDALIQVYLRSLWTSSSS